MITPLTVILARPRGFCAGVQMACDALGLVLQRFGSPVFVYHEIVHNKKVVEDFQARGAIFVNDVEEVPEGSLLMFSAHGIAPQVRESARARNLRVVDATCPLVTKVHLEAIRFAKNGYTVVLIGHAGHDEVVGTLGEAPRAIYLVETPEDVERLAVADPERVACITQTTLSVSDAATMLGLLRARFPNLVVPPKEDICYATQNRQEAVQRFGSEAELVLVVGSQNSSNSQRLVELAISSNVPSYLIDGASDIEPAWLDGVKTALLTAGASAREESVQEVLEYLGRLREVTIVEREGTVEDVRFPLPKGLYQLA